MYSNLLFMFVWHPTTHYKFRYYYSGLYLSPAMPPLNMFYSSYFICMKLKYLYDLFLAM